MGNTNSELMLPCIQIAPASRESLPKLAVALPSSKGRVDYGPWQLCPTSLDRGSRQHLKRVSGLFHNLLSGSGTTVAVSVSLVRPWTDYPSLSLNSRPASLQRIVTSTTSLAGSSRGFVSETAKEVASDEFIPMLSNSFALVVRTGLPPSEEPSISPMSIAGLREGSVLVCLPPGSSSSLNSEEVIPCFAYFLRASSFFAACCAIFSLLGLLAIGSIAIAK